VYDGKNNGVDNEGVTGSGGKPARTSAVYDSLEVEIQSGPKRQSGLEGHGGRDGPQHGRQPSQMIGVPVRQNDCCQLIDSMSPKKGKHNTASGIPTGVSRPPINQNPTVHWGSHGNCIPLTNVEHVDLQPASGADPAQGWE
jgi:hypothetical protein